LSTKKKIQKVLVSGALANKPFNGGNAWTRLDWIFGLRRLGYDVCFVEQIARSSCVDEEGRVTGVENSVNLGYFRSIVNSFGLSACSSLICDAGEEVFGLPLSSLEQHAAESTFLLNISGHLSHPALFNRVACKIYFDDDPGFTQFWHATDNAAPRLRGHDAYFTIGQNIGSDCCSIPTGNIHWQHTKPPVVLEHWPVSWAGGFNRFTTVGSWRGPYGPVRYQGKTLGLKAHEFRKFLPIPQRTRCAFEAAFDIHPGDQKDIDNLRSHGWQLADPRQVAHSPQAYRCYLQASGGEFSAAQGVYVETRSGWFSDRTARYLASGKPALVQDTGFDRHYPTGDGLLSFQDLEEAIRGAKRITRDYEYHCRAARKIAEEHFDSDKVIGQLLDKIGLKLPARS
jgi:hypothetical protein